MEPSVSNKKKHESKPLPQGKQFTKAGVKSRGGGRNRNEARRKDARVIREGGGFYSGIERERFRVRQAELAKEQLGLAPETLAWKMAMAILDLFPHVEPSRGTRPGWRRQEAIRQAKLRFTDQELRRPAIQLAIDRTGRTLFDAHDQVRAEQADRYAA